MKKVILVTILVAILISASSVNVAFAKPADTPKDIAKVVFIHYRKAPVKPEAAKPPKQDGGYKLFLGRVKWADSSLPVKYYVNPSVPAGVDPAAATAQIQAAFEVWDTATGKELFNDVPGQTDRAGAVYDGQNTVAWTYISDSNVIAVTTFWYNTFSKRVLEFDMELSTRFAWGIDPDGEGTAYSLAGAMDIRNIITHEAGHTMVLLDLYNSSSTELTMYGYSSEGEVKKISLASGDIAGVQKLYGK